VGDGGAGVGDAGAGVGDAGAGVGEPSLFKQEFMLFFAEPYAYWQIMPSPPDTFTSSNQMPLHGASEGQRNSASCSHVLEVTLIKLMSDT